MKCPACDFVCSDLRDICPKCMADLRPQKKAIGVFVAYPEASYDELLAKYIKSAESDQSTRKKSGRGFFAGIKRLFSGKQQEAKLDVSPATASAASNTPLELDEPPKTQQSEKIVLENIEVPSDDSQLTIDEVVAALTVEEDLELQPVSEEEVRAFENLAEQRYNDTNLLEDAERQSWNEYVPNTTDLSSFEKEEEIPFEKQDEIIEESTPELTAENSLDYPTENLEAIEPVEDLTETPDVESSEDLKINFDNVASPVESPETQILELTSEAEIPSIDNAAVPPVMLESTFEVPDDQGSSDVADPVGASFHTEVPEWSAIEEVPHSDDVPPFEIKRTELLLTEIPVQTLSEGGSDEKTFSDLPTTESFVEPEEQTEYVPEENIATDLEATSADFENPSITEEPQMPENLSDSSEVLPEDPAPNEIAEPVSLTTQVETEREEEMEEVDQQHQPSDNWIESGAADTPVALTASPVSDTKIVELDSMRNISQPVANDDYRQSIIDEIDSMESSPSLEYSDESEEELLAKAALEAFAYTSGSGVAASSAQQEIIPEISKVTTPINGMIEELAEAFASASRELEEFPAIDDDIRIAQNIDQNTIEETQLLFNLAAKNLLGDPSDTDYLDELLTSDKREVSSEDLDGVLKSTEESIDRSRLSLGIKDHDIDKLRRSIHREEKSVDLFGSHNRKPLPASTKKRAFCFAVDCVASILIGVAATLFVAICFAPELKDKLVHFGEQELYESLPLFSLGIVSIMFAFVTYPIIAFYLFKQTFGAYLSGTKIVREDYRRAHLSNIIARTILLPISLMLMGWLPLLFGRRAAHDWLSRTRVVI